MKGDGYIIFTQLRPDLNEITLRYSTGSASLRRRGELIELDFPIKTIETCSSSASLNLLRDGLGIYVNQKSKQR